MDFSTYIEPKYYIIVVLLYGIGFIMKDSPKLENWVIPATLAVVGAILVTLSEIGSGNPMNINYVIQGAVCGLTAVGTNQIIKQTVEKSDKKETDDTEK